MKRLDKARRNWLYLIFLNLFFNDLICFLLTFLMFTYICPFLNIVVEITDN